MLVNPGPWPMASSLAHKINTHRVNHSLSAASKIALGGKHKNAHFPLPPGHRPPKRTPKEGKTTKGRKTEKDNACLFSHHITLMPSMPLSHVQRKFWNSPYLWPSRILRVQHGSEHDTTKTHTNNVRHDCKETQKPQRERSRLKTTTIGHGKERPEPKETDEGKVHLLSTHN